MTGFEPRNRGIGSDRSTNWATTTAPFFPFLVMCLATTTIRLGDFWRSLKVTNFLSKLDQMHCDSLGHFEIHHFSCKNAGATFWAILGINLGYSPLQHLVTLGLLRLLSTSFTFLSSLSLSAISWLRGNSRLKIYILDLEKFVKAKNDLMDAKVSRAYNSFFDERSNSAR